MNNKQKGLVAVFLFLFLFSGGWYANEWNKRMIHEKRIDRPDLFYIQELGEQNIPHAEPFKPREYIRIGNSVSNLAE